MRIGAELIAKDGKERSLGDVVKSLIEHNAKVKG
jgi:hypothetical protein